jgi:hypothetical protein
MTGTSGESFRSFSPGGNIIDISLVKTLTACEKVT